MRGRLIALPLLAVLACAHVEVEPGRVEARVVGPVTVEACSPPPTACARIESQGSKLDWAAVIGALGAAAAGLLILL
jgi:hypothetical protein